MSGTPPVGAPNAPSATTAAAPLTPGSTQLVPEQDSPTLDQTDVSALGQLHDSSPLQTSSNPNAAEATASPVQTPSNPNDEVEVDEEEAEGYYEVCSDLRRSCRCANYELIQYLSQTDNDSGFGYSDTG